MNIEIIKSNRKSVSIEIKSDLRVIVRAPKGMSNRAVNNFIAEKSDWIEKHIEIMRERLEAEKLKEKPPVLTPDELKKLTAEARKIITERTEQLAEAIGVSYNRISIRHQTSRWGSCSAKGNLNFNCLLILCPDNVRDYVIIHELCHLKEMNHSPEFWAEVARYCTDYKERRLWLRHNGADLINRIKAR